MKVKLILSKAERNMIVAALIAYGVDDLALKIGQVPAFDPAEDGPEATLLSHLWRPRKILAVIALFLVLGTTLHAQYNPVPPPPKPPSGPCGDLPKKLCS